MAACALTGKVKDAGGTARSGVLVRARYVVPQEAASETIVASRSWTSTTTDANGDFSINVEQGSTVRVVIEDAGIDRTFEVPSSATYNLAKEM